MKRFLLLFFAFNVSAVADEVVFNRDIRPILSDRCFHCHGPDEHDRKAKLRLDVADGPHSPFLEREGVVTIKPGSLKDSELWYRITTEDVDDVMPPSDSHKKPLSAQDKELFKKWIEQGAKYEDFWAFSPIRKPAIPRVENAGWNEQPIDAFVLRKLEAKQISPKAEADQRTLVRRVTLDLTGLPPTREEIQQFIADQKPGAYERLVDRLLAKPQYGEHMTKYWLDLVRFADTNGIHHDHYRDLTPYRDWVIRSFNENLPYDDFIKFQLAGDLYPEPTRDQLVASGFHRLHMIIDRGTRLPEESFARNVIDRVTSVGTAFMGLTVECAVCHDHKYDPFTMKDFYSMFAFFNNIDAAAETGGRGGGDFKRGLQIPYINLTTPEEDKRLAKFDQDSTEYKQKIEAIRKMLTKAEDKKPLEKEIKQLEAAEKKASADKITYLMGIPAAMIMKERSEVRPAHIFVRGNYETPGDEVPRATPGFLPPMKNASNPPTRMDLANWFVDKDNPLTARVTVNRFWQQLLGVGIVKTSEDLGAQGEWPSHPDLLEYLSWKFRDSGWDVKALVKEIVMSRTYRQSSEATPEEFHNDPENRLLARGSRYRMDSEIIRDQILATSGLLNPELYGKSVKPPQPEGIWKAVVLPSSFPNRYEPDTGDQIYRRSLYTFWKRGMPHPQMTILNAPTRESCVARRERTNTPLQALLLMNEQEYMKAARNLALKILKDQPQEPVAVAYETITSHLPDKQETALLKDAVADLEKQYAAAPELTAELTAGVDLTGTTAPKLAAWTLLINSIYNLDITKTRQ